MADKLRVGLIGAGAVSSWHMRGWTELANPDIVAIADVSQPARESTAAEFAVDKNALYEDYREMLDKVELDAVDICVPNAFHRDCTVAAFEAGCHVLVEKPIAISAAQAEEMIAAGHEAGKLLMVAQVMRYRWDGATMVAWADAGSLGEVYWGRLSHHRARGVPDMKSFLDPSLCGGGPVYDLGVHLLDLALRCMGFPEPATVSAATYLALANRPSVMAHDPKDYGNPEEMAGAFIRFKNGASLWLETSWALNVADEWCDDRQMLLCGTEGGLQLFPPTLIREQQQMLVNATPQVQIAVDDNPYKEEIIRFVEAIRRNKPSPVPGEEALITQRILDAIYESGRIGKEVEL